MPTIGKDSSVKVVGLRELQAALRALDKDLPKELRETNKEVAEFVAAKARAKAQGLGGVQAKSADAVKAGAEQRRAKITIDGGRFPFSLGAEFGSIQYKQFPPWRGNSAGAGYFVYPTIRETRDETVELYGDLIDKLTKRAFPD